MYCSNCGKEIREDSIFCQFCGADLSVYEETANQVCATAETESANAAPTEVSVQSGKTDTSGQEETLIYDRKSETAAEETMVAKECTKKINIKGILAAAVASACVAALVFLLPKNASKEKDTLFSQGLLPVCEDGEYGYMNEKGEFVIEPQFGMAFNFSADGLARVRGDVGYINKKGEYVLELDLDGKVYNFTNFDDNGLAAVRCIEEDFAGHINKDGEFVYEPIYLDVGEFAENGLAWAAYGSRSYVYINKKGEVVHDGYEWPGDYMDNGLAWVQFYTEDYSDEWALIDGKGNVLAEGFNDVGEFADNGLAWVVDENWQYGFINEKGEIVIEPQFYWAGTFGSNGMAPFAINPEDTYDKYGYINEKGEVVIEPVFERVGSSFSDNGLAVAETASGYGFINKKGEFVIEPQFEGAKSFHNGLAAVRMEERDAWGYINEKGTVVIEPYFTGAGKFYDDGYALVECAGRYGVIDTSGEFIIDPVYEYIRTD